MKQYILQSADGILTLVCIASAFGAWFYAPLAGVAIAGALIGLYVDEVVMKKA